MLKTCNSANYNNTADWNSVDGNVTTVGYNGRSSYYGTYDQTGNVHELLDSFSGGFAIYRGGSYQSAPSVISKNSFGVATLDLKSADLGFRLAKSADTIDSINYILIGDTNNVADSTNNNIGTVGYSYQIKKYLITNLEYTEFLNAVGTTSRPLGLWVSQMGDARQRGGISRSGSSTTGYSFAVLPNMGDKPVNYMSWFNIARYVNWLHNNKPEGLPGLDTTEGGVYTITNFVTSGPKPSPNNKDSYWIPNENEWYKAAYYDPNKNGSGPGYWTYATMSDSLPDSVVSDSTGTPNNTWGTPNVCISPTPTRTVTPSPTPTITSSPTPSITVSVTSSQTPTVTPTPTTTPSVTVSRSLTPSPTVTRSVTPTRSLTPTTTPSVSITLTPTRSPTPTRTPTKSVTPTRTVTPTPSKSLCAAINLGQLIYQNKVYANDEIKILYKGFLFDGKIIPNTIMLFENPLASQTPTPTPTPTPSKSQ